MKKMTLVEKVVLDRLRQKQLAQSIQQPELANLVNVQEQIEDLLGNTHMSDEEKVTMLQRAQNRFTFFKDKLPVRVTTGTDSIEVPPTLSHPTAGRVRGSTAHAPISAVPAPISTGPAPIAAVPAPISTGPAPISTGPAPTAAVTPIVAPAPVGGDLFQNVDVPPNRQIKFGAFKEFLSQNPGLVGKNDKNEMTISGKPITGSNFDNLVRNLYVNKASQNLTGNFEFINALKASNVPNTILSNKKLVSQFWSTGTHSRSPSPRKPTKRSKTEYTKSWGLSKYIPSFSAASTSMGTPRPPPFKFTGKAKSGEEDYQSANEDDPEAQSGHGKPPGKRPRILKLYR